MAKNSPVDFEKTAAKPISADFETAIAATSFGAFNIALLLAALPAAIASVFETSTISYVLPSAECDLQLSLFDKGALYAIPYAGIIISSLLWGYLADTSGRRKILIYGFLADALCVMGAALSQSTMQLLIFKFLGGFVVCGPYAVLITYLTEFHGKQYRASILMSVGIMMTLSTLILPIMAWLILSLNFNFNIGDFQLNSWRLYIALSALPALLSGLLFMRFPESPKFLMSLGRNAEALQIFQSIFTKNTKTPKQNYTIVRLEQEFQTPSNTDGLKFSAKVDAACKQLGPLLRKPYLGLSICIYFMSFCILVGQSTVTLWLPQLFATMSEFEQSSTETPSLCAVIEYSINKTTLLESQVDIMDVCQPVSSASYTNNIIVGVATLFGYILAIPLVNVIGEKWILVISLFSAGVSGIALYWSATPLSTLIISALFVSMGNIAITTIINASVNLFPTLVRTIVVSLCSMFGRCGSLLGNIIFPLLMTIGCVPPFLLISSVMFVAGILTCFLPQTNKMSLK